MITRSKNRVASKLKLNRCYRTIIIFTNVNLTTFFITSTSSKLNAQISSEFTESRRSCTWLCPTSVTQNELNCFLSNRSLRIFCCRRSSTISRIYKTDSFIVSDGYRSSRVSNRVVSVKRRIDFVDVLTELPVIEIRS